ncbi:MAG: hypothetical protein LAO20_09330 [Acidobacteriia bacterium]|nr:hypothetical protein [Terriglobia bacterium]
MDTRAVIRVTLSMLMTANLARTVSAQGRYPDPGDTTSAVSLSKITSPGSVPFHLKAMISEPGKKNSSYRARIEEFWVAPDKWRRSIESPQFSQTMIVNGDKVFEQHTGDYYPFWLRDLVTAMIDLLPEDFSRKKSNAKKPEAAEDPLTVPMDRGTAPASGPLIGATPMTPGKIYRSGCSTWEEPVGTPPLRNSVVHSICVEASQQLLMSVSNPTFSAEFLDYAAFGQKIVPRRIVLSSGPETHIEAQIKELSQIRQPNEALFSVAQPTAEVERVQSLRLSETEARKLLLNSPEIAWNPVHEGKTNGVISVMVYADKEGRVRETWPLKSDNTFVRDQARQEMLKWRFEPVKRDGAPVQTEFTMTLPFQTTIVNPIPLLSNAEARKIAIGQSDPRFLTTTFPKGTEFKVRITVNEHGRVERIENEYKIDLGLFYGAEAALRLWLFTPYKVNGRPQRFNADIVFHVQ